MNYDLVLPVPDLPIRRDRARFVIRIKLDHRIPRFELLHHRFDLLLVRRVGVPLHRAVAGDKFFDQRAKRGRLKLGKGDDHPFTVRRRAGCVQRI